MHIDFNEEQIMLRDSADKFLRDNYSFDARQKTVKSDANFNTEVWQTFAELGWLALPFSENSGGFGWGALELMLLAEKLGRYQVIEPYLETVVLAGGLIEAGGNAQLKDTLLSGIIDGSQQGAFAYAERGCGLPLSSVTTTAKKTANGFSINGSKNTVLNGASADFYIVSAQLEGSEDQLLLVVPANAPGLSRTSYKTYDGRSGCELTMKDVEVAESALVAPATQTKSIVQKVTDQAILFLSAEALGAMETALEATVAYTAQRNQFGQPIGRFQVLRHRMADMFMQVELTRSLVCACAWHLDSGSDRRPQFVAALKAKVGSAGRFVTQSAIQLHGGIGVTDELNVGHFFKRLAIIDNTLGARDYHLAEYAKVS